MLRYSEVPRDNKLRFKVASTVMEIQNQLHIRTVKKMDTYSQSLDSKSGTASSVNSITSPSFPEFLQHYASLTSEMYTVKTNWRKGSVVLTK